MGLGCKPVGKLGGVFKKLDNELTKATEAQKKKVPTPKESTNQ